MSLSEFFESNAKFGEEKNISAKKLQV